MLALAALMAAAAPAQPTRTTIAALDPAQVAGRGAALPFDEYEAENGVTDGTPIGPDRRFGTIAAEASGRRAVRLSRAGQFVEVTLAHAANALTVRAALPDSVDGRGLDSALSVLADGQPIARLPTTSRYGWFYGGYPFSNRPADGLGHHVFDEARILLGRTLPAGTRLRLVATGAGGAAWTAIDLIDAETVPPAQTAPPRAIWVTRLGADRHGKASSLQAFRRGIDGARRTGRPLWIPPGSYRLDGHLSVDRVTILGAGPWYSVLRGDGVGLYGRTRRPASSQVVLDGFAVIGEVRERVDRLPLAGIGGAMGNGSRLNNLFIQHVKVGLWFDGPMDGITIRSLRVVDTMADGLNFHRGVSHASVTNSFFRNTGDDGLAAWSQTVADHHLEFRRNTVIAPILANGIAIYGGHDIIVADNLVADTLTEGGAYHLGNRFGAVPASGQIRFDGNIAVRGGSLDPHWHIGVGALWFYALDAPIAADVTVANMTLLDSSEDAVLFKGLDTRTIRFTDLRIEGAKGHAFVLRSAGAAELHGLSLAGVAEPPLLVCDAGFALSADRPLSSANCP